MPTPLTPDRWRALQALFDQACDLPAVEQATFLDRAEAEDEALAHELRGMLAQAARAPGRIQGAIARATAQLPSQGWPGRRIGAYTIIREIGRGGMGIVFEAVREDEYVKRVAVKIAPSAAVIAPIDTRFRLERQILAELEHPAIARFLDGGTEYGVPYFVMEYVEGTPITRDCVARDLPQRLHLVRQLCDALQHAHERLIVHRDLKPGNILVTADGGVKVLDFGVAKILDPLAEPGTTAGTTPWTPDYASPEQVSGRAISTRTDVYSLGLVLYEILTGTRAQTADTSSPLALQRSVCEQEPPRPSERVTDRLLARRLRGDLDTIVATAIHKDPARRYPSMAALGADLDRHLTGRPILARPGTWSYRAGKLLRRHRLAAAAAVLALAAVAAGLVGTIYQARRAERRFQEVRALANAFVFDVHDRIEPLAGSTAARQAIVRTALVYLERLRDDAGGDAELAKELAAAYQKVGTVQGDPLAANLGDTEGALTSYARAHALLMPLAARGDREARLRLAEGSRTIANIERARGDVTATTHAMTRARETAEALLAQAPADRAVLSLLGEIYADIGRAAVDRRDHAAAEAASSRAMKIAAALLATDPRDPESRNNLATAHNTLGAARIGAGRLPQAADSFRQAIAIREALVRDEPPNVEFTRTLIVSYGNLGDVLGYRPGENLGDTAAAADAFAKAVAIADGMMRADPADRRTVFDVVNARLRLGALLAGDPLRAAEGLRELAIADTLNARLLAAEPESSRYGYLALVLHRHLGETLLKTGRTGEGIKRLERVRAGAATLSTGPLAPNARTQLLLATARLAAVHARTGNRRAADLAAFAARMLAEAPVQPAALDAQVRADLDRTRQALEAQSQ